MPLDLFSDEQQPVDLFADEQQPQPTIGQAVGTEIVKRQNIQMPALDTPRKKEIAAEAQKRGLLDYLMMGAEPALTMATGAIAEPVAGIAGLAKTITGGPEAGAQTIGQIQEAMTYQPRTEPGQEGMQAVGEVLEPVGKALSGLEKTLGDFTFDLTGSPTLSAAAATAPTAVLEALGLVSLKSLRRGTKLIDDLGEPTVALKNGLKKEGLDFDTLLPETKDLIPTEVGPNFLPGSSLVRPEVKKALIEEIKSGSRNDALATLKLAPGGASVRPDKLGKEAIKQGLRPGVVQAIKTANPSTQKKMMEMMKIRKKIKGNERAALDARPDIVIGDSITERLGFLKEKANNARVGLDDIAKNNLRGVDVDPTEVLKTLREHVDDLGIDLEISETGIPKPNFIESIISEDLASQRAIKSLFRLMAKGDRPDALRMHNMKRELDALIDFQKSSKSGLSEAGRRVLKDIRHSVNQTIREVSPEYAKVNDILHEVIGTVDELDKSVGSIDILGEGSNKALGTRMRALMSNQQSRVKIENALDSINETVSNLGGKFDTDIKDLVLFDDMLSDRFGAVARTSLAGQTEQAVSAAITQGPKQGMVSAIGRALGKAAEKARNIGDTEAFDAIEKILNRGIR